MPEEADKVICYLTYAILLSISMAGLREATQNHLILHRVIQALKFQ